MSDLSEPGAPSRWVIDASAMVDILIGAPRVAEVAAAALLGNRPLAAPQLLDLEVMQSLMGWTRRDNAQASLLNERFEYYRLLTVERFEHDHLVDRVWQLRHNFNAYDAAYVALAEALDVPLLTTDERLQRACHGIVDLVPLPATPHQP